MEKPKITTRFFSVSVTYRISDLFGVETKRVNVLVKSNRKDVGAAVMAAYGFEEGTRDIVLQNGKPDAITLMIVDDADLTTVSVHVIDVATQVTLARLENLPVAMSL
jgi:hypothetical protein